MVLRVAAAGGALPAALRAELLGLAHALVASGQQVRADTLQPEASPLTLTLTLTLTLGVARDPRQLPADHDLGDAARHLRPLRRHARREVEPGLLPAGEG